MTVTSFRPAETGPETTGSPRRSSRLS